MQHSESSVCISLPVGVYLQCAMLEIVTFTSSIAGCKHEQMTLALGSVCGRSNLLDE